MDVPNNPLPNQKWKWRFKEEANSKKQIVQRAAQSKSTLAGYKQREREEKGAKEREQYQGSVDGVFGELVKSFWGCQFRDQEKSNLLAIPTISKCSSGTP